MRAGLVFAFLLTEAAAHTENRLFRRPKHHHHHHHESHDRSHTSGRVLAALAEPSVIPSRGDQTSNQTHHHSSHSSNCDVSVLQSQVDTWQSWMQEGFTACSTTANQQVDNSSNSLVMCYRVGFVDQEKKQFGGELLVLQVGTPQLNATRSSKASETRRTRSSSTSSRSLTFLRASSTTSLASTTSPVVAAAAAATPSTTAAAAAAVSSPVAAGSSPAPGIGAIVVASSQVPIPVASSTSVTAATPTAEADTQAAATGVSAGSSSGSSSDSDSGYGGYRRKRDSSSNRRFTVELSFEDSQPLTADMSFVEKLSSRTSTNITSPAFAATLGGQQAMLIGSFHFTRSFPSGVDGKDVSQLAPRNANIVGQAKRVLNVQNAFVNLAGVSSSEQGFNSTGEWGLYLASSSRSRQLTADNRCHVRQVDDSSSSSSSASSSTTQAAVTSSTTVAAAAVQTPAPTPATSTSIAIVAGAAIVLSSAVVPLTSLAVSSVVSGSSSGLVAASGVILADSASSSSTPGSQIQVLPVGLGVTAGAVSLGALIIGFVTWERRKYRKAYRERRLEEQLAQLAHDESTFRGPQDRRDPSQHVGLPYMSERI